MDRILLIMKKKCLRCGFTFWQGKTYSDTVLVLLIMLSFFAVIVAYFYGGFLFIGSRNPMISDLTLLLMGLIALVPVAYWITERREKCPRCNSKTWTYIESEEEQGS